jgi:hypothetical protein
MTDRDLGILDFIERAQPVGTAAIEIFSEMSLAMTRRRLRVLFNLGTLRVFMRGQEFENLYALLQITSVSSHMDADLSFKSLLPLRVPRMEVVPHTLVNLTV